MTWPFDGLCRFHRAFFPSIIFYSTATKNGGGFAGSWLGDKEP